MIKVSTFLAESEFGLNVFPLFGPADSAFEKTAAPHLLPEVLRYIEGLTPRNDSQYVLVNAMGAGEFFGSNINGDHFPEAGLIHRPDSWSGSPIIDKGLARNWPYGFPTFYSAYPFAHHRNKDPKRAYGEVELSVWNDHMKRVELVTRVDLELCQKNGGVPVWDKLKDGQFPDVSMGSKVPFDTCSICLDWKLYREALATFDPKKHKHPGMAALEFHKKLKAKNGKGIQGLSITRKDYCEHAGKEMNKIYADGRKVFVYNDFPRFFDISFVFIGADRTAKVMVFIQRAGQRFSVPSAVAAEKLGFVDSDIPDIGVKVASVHDDLLKAAFLRKSAKDKEGAIEKDVEPNLPPGKAIPALTKREKDLPEDVMGALGAVPLKRALATLSGLGMVLRPSEFATLKGGREDEEQEFGKDDFMPALARMLAPMMHERSGLGPIIERRVIIICSKPATESAGTSSLSPDSLRKMGSAYTAYRRGLMDTVAHTQELIESAAGQQDHELRKLAEAPVEEVFTPLAYRYLDGAFKDEAPEFAVPDSGMVQPASQVAAGVQRGIPSRNT